MVSELIDPDHVVGAAEIPDRLGVAHAEAVHNWRRQYPEFPQPAAAQKQSFIWSWPAVEQWAWATGGL